MKSNIITTLAPKAIGPYCQATTAGDFIFTSGQLPSNPLSMEFTGNDKIDQSRQVLHNTETILLEGNSSLSNVLKATCFLSDLENFNKLHADFLVKNLLQRAHVSKYQNSQ